MIDWMWDVGENDVSRTTLRFLIGMTGRTDLRVIKMVNSVGEGLG